MQGIITTMFLKRNSLYFLLPILLLLIYWTPMTSPGTIWVDDDWLLHFVRKFNSLFDYLSSYIRYESLDRQPIRDLSIYFDDVISSCIGFPIFRVTNVLIWMGALIAFQRILVLWQWPLLWIQIASLYVGTHPVTVNSVAMLASRKHLLSVFFILLSFYFFLRQSRAGRKFSRESIFLSLVCYGLSCLSQPIHVLTPLGFIFFIENKKIFLKENKYFTLVFVLVAGATLLDNYAYYSSEDYLRTVGYSKFIVEQSWLKRFLIYGRSFYQIILPEAPSILPYDLGNIRGWIGLILLLAFSTSVFILKFKRVSAAQKLFCSPLSGTVLMFFLPLLVVTVKLTEQGGWDTYLLLSLFSWVVFLQIIFSLFQLNELTKQKKWLMNFCVIIAVAFIGINSTISYQQAQYFISAEKVLERMAKVEHSNLYRMMYAQSRINNHPDEIDKIYDEAVQVYHSNPKTANLGYVFGRSLVYTKRLSDDEKFRKFNEFEVESLWWFYWKAVFYAQRSNYVRANEILIMGWVFMKDKQLNDVEKLDEIIKNWIRICELSSAKNCQNEINELIQK